MTYKEEIILCSICNRNIREIKAFPVYYKKKDTVICSHCCLIGAIYHEGIITEKQLEPIPKDIRIEIMKIYKGG